MKPDLLLWLAVLAYLAPGVALYIGVLRSEHEPSPWHLVLCLLAWPVAFAVAFIAMWRDEHDE